MTDKLALLTDTDSKYANRIISVGYKVVKAYDKDIPFSQSDKNQEKEIQYITGVRKKEVSPKYRYSTYISQFNEVAEKFGFKFKEYIPNSVWSEGDFLFTHEDPRFPSIKLCTGINRMETSFIIKMHSPFLDSPIPDCNSTLKTHDDCFNLLMKKLNFYFKNIEDDIDLKDVIKKIALQKIIHKLKK